MDSYSIKKLWVKGRSRFYVRLQRYYFILNVFELKISGAAQAIEHADRYSLEPMTLEILGEMYRQHTEEIGPRKYDILKNRVEARDEEAGFIVASGADVCGYFHILYGRRYCENMSGLVLSLDRDTGVLFDDYTFAPFRRRGIHQFAVRSRLRIMREKGYAKAVALIMENNEPSEKTYMHVGFTQVARTYCFRLGKFKRAFYRKNRT